MVVTNQLNWGVLTKMTKRQHQCENRFTFKSNRLHTRRRNDSMIQESIQWSKNRFMKNRFLSFLVAIGRPKNRRIDFLQTSWTRIDSLIQESIYKKSIPFIFSSNWTPQESKNRFFTDLLDMRSWDGSENRFYFWETSKKSKYWLEIHRMQSSLI